MNIQNLLNDKLKVKQMKKMEQLFAPFIYLFIYLFTLLILAVHSN